MKKFICSIGRVLKISEVFFGMTKQYYIFTSDAVNNSDIRKRYEICSKLPIKTLKPKKIDLALVY